jgi:DNA-binding NarL/FixJ family response regulator
MQRRAQSDPLRVVVADGDPEFAEFLATIVDANERYEVIGIAADGEEAVQLSVWQDADVVLLDVDLPKIDGLRAIELLRKGKPRTCVLLVSGLDDERAAKARAAGAYASISKSRAAVEVERTLQLLARESEVTA